MSISLNSPVSHVVKITWQIPVYLEIEDRFPIGRTAEKLKNHFGLKMISGAKTLNKHNL